MTLSWRDLVTTVMTAAVAGMYYFRTQNTQLPVIGESFRWLFLVLGLLGLGICIVNGAGSQTNTMNWSNPWTAIAGIMGVISFILIIGGLITGSQTLLVGLVGTIALLWLVSTIHHVVGN